MEHEKFATDDKFFQSLLDLGNDELASFLQNWGKEEVQKFLSTLTQDKMNTIIAKLNGINEINPSIVQKTTTDLNIAFDEAQASVTTYFNTLQKAMDVSNKLINMEKSMEAEEDNILHQQLAVEYHKYTNAMIKIANDPNPFVKKYIDKLTPIILDMLDEMKEKAACLNILNEKYQVIDKETEQSKFDLPSYIDDLIEHKDPKAKIKECIKDEFKKPIDSNDAR